jgi:phosphoribosylanthranilate isomerase
MKVKICGITDLDTARIAVKHGADALGFVFTHSKREISPDAAREIIKQLPEEVDKVGVFVNETVERVKEIVEISGINMVQLHGDETPSDCSSFGVPVIKSFSIGSVEDLINVQEYATDFVLFDSPRGQYHGGNGKLFDWRLLENIENIGNKLILAGGLTVKNVGEAVRTVQPHMVDVSSGVESDGKKDHEKIKKFIEKAKNAN